MWESAGSYSSWVASWSTKEAKLEEEGEGGPEYQGNPGVFTSQAQVTANPGQKPPALTSVVGEEKSQQKVQLCQGKNEDVSSLSFPSRVSPN